MANDIDKTSPHYKGEFGSIYEVNQKFPSGGVEGDYVAIDGWAHYWNADRGTWCVNAQRDSYWDELITSIIEKFKLFKGATYMGVAGLDTVPAKAIGAKMYYFATVAGTYKNFGGLVVPQGINVLYSEDGSSWVCSTLLEVAQELGVSTRNVVSQKVVNDALNLKANQSSVNEALAKKADKETVDIELGKKANTADVDTKFREEKKRVDAELGKKVDKEEGKSLIDSEVAAAHSVINTSEFMDIETDADDNVLACTYADGSHYAYNMKSETIDELSDTKVDKENGKSLIDFEVAAAHSVINTSEFMDIETDADDNVLACTYADGSHYAYNMKSETIDELSSNLSEKIEKLKEKITGSNVVLRNEQNTDALFSACRYNTLEAQGKDLQLCIVTDSHGETTPVYNAVKLTSNFASIDAIIHCGDICTYIYDSSEVQSVIKVMSSCVKPWFIVVGNHDVGNTLYLNAAATHDEIFTNFILPMIESGILTEGEYTYGKNYYYHDFKESKIRLIVPYEYDNPLDVADNDYWNVVEYDSTAAMVKPGSSYSVGDKINCGGYKEHSFVCKKNVVTIDNTQNADYTLHTLPYYKCGRAARVIMAEQARWFIDTLNSTPEGYGIVVATHNPAMINSSNVKDYKFAVSSDLNAKDDGMYAMETDLFSELINGFNNKTTGNIKVKMCHSGWHTADASYLNVNGDSDKYAYSLDYDFTNVKANFIAYIGGHSHRDLVFKHNSYGKQYSINPVCASNNKQQRHAADIPNVNDVNSLAFDALTVVTFRKNSLILNRLGNQWSTDGKHRDFELIKIK